MKINFLPRLQLIAWEPIAAAGIGLASQGANMAAQGKMNLRTRQFAEEMYFRQRADALLDWNMQNNYNSPAEQMKRFKAAGLNPNLIYGQGNTADAVRSSNMQSWNPQTPKFDGGAVMGKYMDTKMQMAQQDLLAQQKRLMEQEIELKRAQTIFQNVQSETGTFDLALKNTLRDRNIQLADYNNEAKALEISRGNQQYDFERLKMSMDIQQNDLNAAIKQQSIQKGIEEIANLKISRAKTDAEISAIKQAVSNAEKDGRIKELDAQLADKLIRPGDPIWLRSLFIILNKYFPRK